MIKQTLYKQVIGTGGIGSGILFNFDDNRPLSRNETRMASLSKAKDYCKLHIILHYIARILSPELLVYAIGVVGQDQAGAELTAKMKRAGIDTTFVHQTTEKPTMFAVCLQYPDKSVCNVTTAESASSLLSESDIVYAVSNVPTHLDEHTIAIAVPEVPVQARLTLLKLAKAAGAFCVSSYLYDEVSAFVSGGGLANTDMLVINEDEAAALCNSPTMDQTQLAKACYEIINRANPSAKLVVTFGASGSYVCDLGLIRHIPAQPVNAVATGGAGDAFIAGTICGIIMGYPFVSNTSIIAAEIGSRIAAESVTVIDTIAEHIDRSLTLRIIREIAGRKG